MDSIPSTSPPSSSSTATLSDEQKAALLQLRFPTLPLPLLQQLLSITLGDVDLAISVLGAQGGEGGEEEGEGEEEEVAEEEGEGMAGEEEEGECRPSVVEPHGSHGSRCGYCHATADGRRSFGLTSSRMRVEDYQAMMDRGWRRSGDYFYKPDNVSSCCPNYTIRLDTRQFIQSKAQRKVTRKFEQFLKGNREGEEKGEEEGKEDRKEGEERKVTEEDEQLESLRRAILSTVLQLQSTGQLRTALTEVKSHTLDSGSMRPAIASSRCSVVCVLSPPLPVIVPQTLLKPQLRVYLQPLKRQKGQPSTSDQSGPPEYQYSSNIAFLLSSASKEINVPLPAQAAAELIQSALIQSGLQCSVSPPAFLNFPAPAGAEPPPRGSRKRSSPSFDDSNEEKKRMTDTPMEAATVGPSTASSPTTAAGGGHQLTVTQVRAVYTEEAYNLYRKYQHEVHGDALSEIRPRSYQRFLCTSTLKSTDPEYGSFHHQYRIDGVLVAVGVVDILPSSLSSVYFFYDASYHHLSLGVWSALREIEWVQRFSLTHPSCQYYVMGFYIHSCPKMRYKAQFFPTQVLCPVRYTWHLLDACIPYLEQHKYVIFSDVVPPFVGPQQLSVERGKAGKKRVKQPNDATPQNLSLIAAASSPSPPAAAAAPAEDPQFYTVNADTVTEEKRKNAALEKSVLPRVPLKYQQREISYQVRLTEIAPRATTRFRSLMSEYGALMGEELALKMRVAIR